MNYRVRMRFGKQGDMRYVSHLDLAKLFERVMRRAGLPLAFSEGFNPHPKLSFASPLAVGVASEAEYLDVELEKAVDPDEIIKRIVSQLPAGIMIHEAKPVASDSPALMAVIDTADYEVSAELFQEKSQEEVEQAIDHLLGLPEALIERQGKKGLITRDVLPGIINITGKVAGKKLILYLRLKTGSSGNTRPEDVAKALEIYSDLPIADHLEIIRKELYTTRGQELLTPMDLC